MSDDNQNYEFDDAFKVVKSIFAANLRKYRKQSKLSQEELGHKINADQAYVSRLEKAALNPTLEIITEISVVLKVPVEQLFKKQES